MIEWPSDLASVVFPEPGSPRGGRDRREQAHDDELDDLVAPHHVVADAGADPLGHGADVVEEWSGWVLLHVVISWEILAGETPADGLSAERIRLVRLAFLRLRGEPTGERLESRQNRRGGRPGSCAGARRSSGRSSARGGPAVPLSLAGLAELAGEAEVTEAIERSP